MLLFAVLLVALPSAPTKRLGSHSTLVHHSCMGVVNILAKADQHHLLYRCVSSQEALRFPHRDLGGPLHRKAVSASADRRKSNGANAMLHGQRKAASIAACEQLIFAVPPIAPDRANRMNDPFRPQPVALGDPRLPGRTASQLPALRQQLRSGSAMYRTVHAAPPSRVVFAALTMASTACFVISPSTTSILSHNALLF